MKSVMHNYQDEYFGTPNTKIGLEIKEEFS